MSVCVAVVNGIVVAVCKQILRSGTAVVDKAICADKPPELRAIVPAIQVIKPGFGIVIVPPVAEGVFVAHGVAGGVGDSAFAPGVVAVLGHDLPRGGPDDGNNIPLQVVEIVEQHGPVGEAYALAGAVVDEAHDAVAGFLRQDLGAAEEKFRGGAVDCLAGADTVGVVLVAVSIAAIGDFPQLPALPGVAGAVVAGHVANAVVGDGLAVVLGQQIGPAAVAVGVSLSLQNLAQGTGCIGVPLDRQDVPGLAVGVDEGGVLGLAVVAGQLVFLVVGILLPQGLGVVGGPDPLGGDVAGLVVRIVQVRNAQKPRVEGVVDAPDRRGGAVGVGGPVDVAVGRLDVVVVVIGLVGDGGGAGEAVVGVGHLADAEEGGAGREVVRRGVGIGRGAGDTVKVVAQKRGLVNGVVPVLQPVAVRAIHPGGTAQGIVGIDVAPVIGEIPVTPQLPGGVVDPLALLDIAIRLAGQPVHGVVAVVHREAVAVLRGGQIAVIVLVGIGDQGPAPGGGLQGVAEGVVLSSSILLDPILFKHCKQKLNVHRVSIYTDSAPFGFQSQTVCTETIVHAFFIGYTVSFSQQIANKEIVFASG